MTRLLMLAVLVTAFGCKEDAPKPKATPPTPAAKVADPAPATGGGNTNYIAGGGAAQNVRQAGKRVEVLNDMKNLGLAISTLETQNGKMPTKSEILADIRTDAKLSKLVADGTIILTGSTNRSGLWAYEVDADTKGGIGLVAGTANRYSADEITNLKRGG